MTIRWISFPIIAAMGIGIYWLFSNLQTELVPIEDRSELTIRLTGPEGATFSFMDQVISDFSAQLMRDLPESELKGHMSMTSPSFSAGSNTNSGFFRLYLTNSDQRARSQQEIFSQVNGALKGITAVRAFAQQPASIGDRRGGLPVQYVIQAPTLEKLKEVIPKFMEKASQNPAFIFTDINLKFTKPELEIEIDRERARNMGVSVQEIARTLQLSYSGQRFAYFIRNGKQYQVIGEMQLQDRNEPVNLRMLYVKGDNGELIQLDNLVRIVEKSTPPQLYRFNRFVSATVSANLADGVTIGAGLDEMDKIAAEVLDESYATDVTGPSKEFRESSNSLLFAFIFALVLIYLVLAAQFESFADPLTIMFTVPLAIFGALATLWIFDFTLNIFSQIGIIMLIGLVTKNGILIVEFANQRKEQGMDVEQAIFGAAVSRFRPILMTSLSTILGILPIALALGAGAESRVPMGAAVIGGLAFSTVLTLFVIPGVYTYLTSKKGVLAKTV